MVGGDDRRRPVLCVPCTSGLDLRIGDMRDLELEALCGDFDRGPLTPASREYVFVVRR